MSRAARELSAATLEANPWQPLADDGSEIHAVFALRQRSRLPAQRFDVNASLWVENFFIGCIFRAERRYSAKKSRVVWKRHRGVRQNRSRRDHKQNERRFRAELCENHENQARLAAEPNEAPGSDCKQLWHRSGSKLIFSHHFRMPSTNGWKQSEDATMFSSSKRKTSA